MSVFGNVFGTSGSAPTAGEIATAVWSHSTRTLTSGGGGEDWTANERTAIRAILGIPTSGTTPEDPTTGILDTIRDKANDVGTDVTTLLSRLSATRAAYLDNLSAGAVALASSLTSAASDITTILGKFSGITLLAQWLGLIAGKQTGNATARTELRATGAGSGTFDETTDSLEGIRDTAATVGGMATAVRDELATELARIDVAVSSRLASGSYTAPLDAAGVRTAVGLASANLDTQLTNMGNLDAAVSTRLATAGYTAPANSDITAIKAKTDNLTFTDDDEVKAYLTKINTRPLKGDGTPGNKFGPLL